MSWDAGWEVGLLVSLLAAAALLVLALFLLNRIHAHRAERVLRLEEALEQTVLGWARDDLVRDESERRSRLHGRDRDVLLRVCLRILPSLDPGAIDGVRGGLSRWGLLDRELANLRHRSSARRADACRVLGRLGHAPAIPALIERLEDRDPVVRQRAIAALGDLRAVGALDRVVGAKIGRASCRERV